MNKSYDALIVGGGVMGCSLAYYLAKLGIKSTVLERSKLASGASGATAGVIAPLWHVNRSSEAMFALGMRSLDRFPTLANELIEAGVDPGFRQNGLLKIAFSPEEVDELKQQISKDIQNLSLSFIFCSPFVHCSKGHASTASKVIIRCAGLSEREGQLFERRLALIRICLVVLS